MPHKFSPPSSNKFITEENERESFCSYLRSTKSRLTMGQEQGNQYVQQNVGQQFNNHGWSEPQSNSAGWSNVQVMSRNNNQHYRQQSSMPQQASGDCTQGGAVYNPAMGTNMGLNSNGQPVPAPDCAGNNINWNPLNVNLNMFKIPEAQPDPNCKSCESKDLPFDPRFQAPPGFPEFAGVKAGYIEAYM